MFKIKIIKITYDYRGIEKVFILPKRYYIDTSIGTIKYCYYPNNDKSYYSSQIIIYYNVNDSINQIPFKQLGIKDIYNTNYKLTLKEQLWIINEISKYKLKRVLLNRNQL